jgi:putative colanic acid biosysnthesis UDP-glucose lipid carrier transferase
VSFLAVFQAKTRFNPVGGLPRLHGKDIARFQRLLDPLIITGLFIALEPDRVWSTPVASIPFWCLIAVALIVLLPRSGIYASYRHRSLHRLMRRISSSWLLLLGLLLLATYFNKSTASFSRVSTTTWAFSGWLWLISSHVFCRKLLRWHRSCGGNSRTIVYWGMPDAAAAFARQISNNPWMGLQIVAWFSPVQVSPDTHTPDCPVCSGGIRELRQWLLANEVDRLVFSHVTTDGLGMDQMVELFGDTSIPVVYAPHWSHPTMRFTVDSIGDQPCIDLWGSEQSLLDRQLKRTLDLLLTCIGVVVIAPLLLLIALAVRLSGPGPIFYKQDRYGLDGKPFKCFKFRSMRVFDSADQAVVKQATADDPRITPVGRFLRRWSLDELPQVFNVLLGDMSLVGPRPHAVQHNELYRKLIPGYMQRHAFKPGITGLAQVSGWRGETSNLSDMANRIDADLRYQRDWSLKLDIKILIKTFLRLRSGNAY